MASETPDNGPAAGRPPETVDRMLVGACALIWLAVLAMAVVAGVSLARLASGHPGGGERQSSSLLYAIIVVSALIIAAAVPLLMRARNARRDRDADEAAAVPAGRVRPPEAPTEKMRVFGVDPYAPRAEADPSRGVVPAALLDRLWLRGTVSLAAAMGVALFAVAAGSSLLASGSDTGAWVALGLAGVGTVAMPAVLAFFQRRLAEAEDEATGQ